MKPVRLEINKGDWMRAEESSFLSIKSPSGKTIYIWKSALPAFSISERNLIWKILEESKDNSYLSDTDEMELLLYLSLRGRDGRQSIIIKKS